MSHQGSVSSYQPNNIVYPPWLTQGEQLEWLKQEYRRYDGDNPALVLSPQFVMSIHSQLLNNWPSMNLDCTPQDIQIWWETEHVVRRFNNLNYPASGVNIPPLAAQWNQPINETDVFTSSLLAQQPSLYPVIPSSLNQPVPQSATYTQFSNQQPNLGHYIPPLSHDMLPNQQQPAGRVPFHDGVPNGSNYQSAPPHHAIVGNTRAATPASETIPGLNNPPSLPNEPPATRPKKKKSKNSKVNDANPQPQSDYDVANGKIVHKAAHIWSKSGSHDVDFSTLVDQELREKDLPANNRLATLNRLVIAAWDLLSEEEQRPWIDQAVELQSAELSLAEKNKKAIKKFDKTAQTVLDDYGSWSFYVLWGKNDAKFGQTVVRGNSPPGLNSPSGVNFSTWFKVTHPEEFQQFMDRLGEYSDSMVNLLNQLRPETADDTDEVDTMAAINGQLPQAVRELLELDHEGLKAHELRKHAHTIFVDLWKAAGWDCQVPWLKIAQNPQKFCNKSLLPNWWLFANPGGSNANKNTLNLMLDYLKKGSDGLLPAGHSFRFYPRDSSRAEDEDATDDDDDPIIAASNNRRPSTSTAVPTVMDAATANATTTNANTAPNAPNSDEPQQRDEDPYYEQNKELAVATIPTSLPSVTVPVPVPIPAPPTIPTGRTLKMPPHRSVPARQHDLLLPPATPTATTAPAPAVAATTTNTNTNVSALVSTPSAVDPLPTAAHSPPHPPRADPADTTANDPEDPIWPPPMTEEYVNSAAGKREQIRRMRAGATAPGQRMASPPPTKPARKRGKASVTTKHQAKSKKDTGSGAADLLQQEVVVRRTSKRNQAAIEPAAIEVPTSPSNAKRTIEDVFESDQALDEPATESRLTRSGRKRSKANA